MDTTRSQTTTSHETAITDRGGPAAPQHDAERPDELPSGPLVTIRPWIDPVVDRTGHDPRAAYVEVYWLGVIGPTATWIMRRLAERFDDEPEGFRLDLDHLARSMGLSWSKGNAGPFGRALQRCVMFGLAQQLSDGYSVRRRVPMVAQRHLRRLPPDLQSAHAALARAARA